MPEPNEKMDALLKASAKRRQEEAGAPLELHPATPAQWHQFPQTGGFTGMLLLMTSVMLLVRTLRLIHLSSEIDTPLAPLGRGSFLEGLPGGVA